MLSRKVVLTTFASPIEAQIARTQLEDAEIWCLVADDGIVATDPLLAIAVGGVRVLVFEEDVERATEVLAGPRDGSLVTPEFEEFLEDDGDSEADDLTGTRLRCPSCGSEHVGFATWVLAFWAATALIALVGLLGWDELRAMTVPVVLVLVFIGGWATILRRVPLKCNNCAVSGPRTRFQNRL